MTVGPGSVVAGYRIEHELGAGGMGVVYAATQISLQRPVALKLVLAHHGQDLAFRERFRREGLAQAALDHPHIVTVYEAGEFEGSLFIAMRLVPGASLKELIKVGQLDMDRALRILGPVADALDSAHEAGLIHRDVKPHNVLVGRRDHGFLADFGLTKVRDGASLTQTGQFVGSVDYVSPEQIRGETATAQSDVYSFGAMLYECLTGVVPFPKETDIAVLYAHMSAPRPAVTKLRPGLPERLDQVIAAAMDEDPERRPPSAVALVEATLDALAGTERSLRSRPTIVPPVPRRREQEVPTEAEAPLPETDPERPTPPTRERPSTPSLSPRDRPTASRPIPQSVPDKPDRRAALVAAGVVAALVAGGGAYLAGHSTTKTQTAGTRVVEAGAVTINAPNAWRGPETPVTIAGLEFKRPITLEDPTGAGALVVGMLPAARDRTLLPETFLDGRDRPAIKDGVALGDLSAYRFAGLNVPRESAPVTVYTSPTSEGTLGAACTGPAAVQRACEGILGTVLVDDAKPLALGPSAKYVRATRATVDELERVAGVAKRLRDARKRDGQAEALRDLSAIYAAAAKSAGSAAPGPEAADAADALEKSLRDASRAYGALAKDAGAGRTAAYDRGREAAGAAVKRADEALAQLAELGYGRPA